MFDCYNLNDALIFMPNFLLVVVTEQKEIEKESKMSFSIFVFIYTIHFS